MTPLGLSSAGLRRRRRIARKEPTTPRRARPRGAAAASAFATDPAMLCATVYLTRGLRAGPHAERFIFDKGGGAGIRVGRVGWGRVGWGLGGGPTACGAVRGGVRGRPPPAHPRCAPPPSRRRCRRRPLPSPSVAVTGRRDRRACALCARIRPRLGQRRVGAANWRRNGRSAAAGRRPRPPPAAAAR